jgi:hypothetical protein
LSARFAQRLRGWLFRRARSASVGGLCDGKLLRQDGFDDKAQALDAVGLSE